MRSFDVQTDVLMLDFDGVIANSIHECLVSGYNAYADYSNAQWVYTIDELNPDWVHTATQMRNFIRNGEDYVYIAHALALDVPIQNQKDFDEFKEKHIDLCSSFFDLFYNARMTFAQSRPEQWIDLNPLYGGMADFLKSFKNKNNLFIITTKLLFFVRKILTFHSIEFRQENLFDTSDGRTKVNIITDIFHERHIDAFKCYFLDDQVDTVIKVSKAGVHAILADWGYNNKLQIDTAHQQDLPVITKKQFVRFFSP